MMDTNRRAAMLAFDLFSVPVNIRESFHIIYEKMDTWVKNEGNGGMKRSKELFSFTLSYLLGEKPSVPKWTRKSRFQDTEVPTLLLTVFPWIIENPRIGLTLLRYSDLFTAHLSDEECERALSPIKEPSSYELSPLDEEGVLQVASRFSIPTLHVEIGTIPMFSKGPNGISVLSIHRDSHAIQYENLVPQIRELSERIAQITPGIKPSKVIRDILTCFPGKPGYKSGRVVFLPEKSGKIRVIAQGDYISQSVLKPIHDSLAGILKRVPGDWTFDQEGGKEWVRRKTETAKFAASYDLSNATDRLPAFLQARILDRVLPGNLGTLWYKVINARTFTYTLPSGKEGEIRYSVGQPMGFYSSFVSFALLHHCLVQYAFEKAHGRPGRNFYAIIGDDIVIFDQATGEVYQDLISKVGGVLNLSKSRISTTRGDIRAEFAKAYFRNGVDFTPLSLRMIRSSLDNWTNVPKIYNLIRTKLGITLSAKALKRLFQSYWPNEANTLELLLEVPELVGGFGKKGHTPLSTVLNGNSKLFRRYLAYRALEAYKIIAFTSDGVISKAYSDVQDRNDLRVAMEPFLKLLRDRNQMIGLPHVVTSRKGFLEWAMDEGTPISSLLECVTLMNKELPTSLREKVARPSVLWIRALVDDRRSPSRDPDPVLTLKLIMESVLATA